MDTSFKKYVREDGKVAVLYAFFQKGAWSTVAELTIKEKLIFDSRIVELVLAEAEEKTY